VTTERTLTILDDWEWWKRFSGRPQAKALIIEKAAGLTPRELADLPDDLCDAIDQHYQQRHDLGNFDLSQVHGMQDRDLVEDLLAAGTDVRIGTSEPHPLAHPVDSNEWPAGGDPMGYEEEVSARPRKLSEAEEVVERRREQWSWGTKDSGEKRVHASGMVRDQDAGKPAFHLMLPKGVPFEDQMLTRLAGLYARGADKYGDRNWELSCTAEDEEHIAGSLFRHLIHLLCGDTDEDHAAAVMWNVVALELARRNQKEAEKPEGPAEKKRDPAFAPKEKLWL
jgi:hypothetical protein